MPTDPLQSYSIPKTAELLAISPDEVRRRIASGDIRAVDIRRKGASRALWRVLASEIERLLKIERFQDFKPPEEGDHE